jgi:hypothetical protein
MQNIIYISLITSILFIGCIEMNSDKHLKIDEFIQDVDLLKCEFGKSIESEDFKAFRNYKYVYLIKEDLDGDGEIEDISIRVDSVFFDDDPFQKEESFNAILVVNQQFVPFVMNMNAIQGGIADNNYNACKLIVVDVSKNDSYKEICLEMGRYLSYGHGDNYLARYTKNLLTLTKIEAKKLDFPNHDFIELSYSKTLGYTDDSEEEARDYSEQLQLYSVGFNISKIDSSEIYTKISAACPYLYVIIDKELLYKGEIIRNIIGKEAEAKQSLELGAFKKGIHTFRIWEKKDEVSYINEIQFVASDVLLEYQISANIKELIQLDDNKYFLMNKEDFIDIQLNLLHDTENLIIYAKGYYIPTFKNPT